MRTSWYISGTALNNGWVTLLLTMVLYNHWRSEHLFVHHRYVGTPKIRKRPP